MKHGDPGWQEYFRNRNNEIMKQLDAGRTQTSIAKEFGVSKSRIPQIKRKETWIRLHGKPADLRLKENKWYPDDHK